MKDPYQILGVAKTATQDEIKKAYRGLAKKLHPDLNPGNKEAEAKFKEISYAYDLIGTPESRAKFDRGEFAAEEAAKTGAAGGGPFYYQTQGERGGRYTYSFNGDFDEDLFSSIFGAMGGAGTARRRSRRASVPTAGEDQLFQMEIGLRDAALGAEREITLPSGKRLAVKIPAGVTDGLKLRFAGQGAPGLNGGPAGDVYIELRVSEDARFKRQGDSLVMELPISISEAVLGANVLVPTIDGNVTVKVPKHSNTDQKLRLSGKGLFNRATKKRGDQIIILKVVLPKQPDAELEEALRAWSARHPYDPRENVSTKKGAA